MVNWIKNKGPDSDVVISSRIRLARNIQDIPFPSIMDDKQAEEVVKTIKDAIFNSNTILASEFIDLQIDKLNDIDIQRLVEIHVISPDLIKNRKRSAVLLRRDETVSIMINEEDHLRIQCLNPGFQLENVWDLADKIDDVIEENVTYAFDEHLGYLTCCPTNVGTGIRASVMLHLPALTITGYIKGMLQTISKIGLTVRGLYGEGTEATGNMFQLSNQLTLGQSEEDIINNVTTVTHQLVEKERAARENIARHDQYGLEDKVYRSYGILSNARKISSKEAMDLLSDVRMGVDMGILKEVDINTINQLMFEIQPASVQKLAGEIHRVEQRDIARAGVIRQRLNKE
ncbi:MAG: protein arginine kinase [Mahellales bacterium]|jgi:protein arginine kinase